MLAFIENRNPDYPTSWQPVDHGLVEFYESKRPAKGMPSL